MRAGSLVLCVAGAGIFLLSHIRRIRWANKFGRRLPLALNSSEQRLLDMASIGGNTGVVGVVILASLFEWTWRQSNDAQTAYLVFVGLVVQGAAVLGAMSFHNWKWYQLLKERADQSSRVFWEGNLVLSEFGKWLAVAGLLIS